jgi:DnaJ-class molecular chaperone
MQSEDKYRAIDQAVGNQIKREMRCAGVNNYPAVCDSCHGTGKCAGQHCDNCNGQGSYELAI